MAKIPRLTPVLSHRQRAAWYHQFAQQLEAGLPFVDAVRSARGVGMPAAALEAMAAQVEGGGSIDAAFATAERWLPRAERLVLAASAEAGRLPHTLQSLSRRHAEVAKAKLRLALACAYPLAVLHVGLLLLPVLGMIDWETGLHWDLLRYLRTLLFTLGPLWLAIVALVLLARRQNPVLGAIGRVLPFVGGYLRAQGISDFAFALGNLLDAGVPIDRAWASAGATTTLPDLRRAADTIGTVIARGEAPGAKLAAAPCFPPDFVALYRTGEATGQLELNLFRLASQYQEHANRALTLASLFYPALMFVGVAVAVAVNVIRFYAGYLKMIEKLGS